MTCGIVGCPHPAKGGEDKDPLCRLHAVAIGHRIAAMGRSSKARTEARRALVRIEGELRASGAPIPWRDE